MADSLDADSAELSELLALGSDEPGYLQGTQKRIAAAALKVFHADVGLLFAINPITGRFLPDPTVEGERRKARWEELAPPPEPLGRDQELLRVVDDPAAEPAPYGELWRAEGVRSLAVLILRTSRQSKPLAVLYLGFRQAQRWADRREPLLRFGRE
ncbi:MAG TPA: hypothetical protein VGE98_16775, partial [Thermoanaerobaculia bacterium]